MKIDYVKCFYGIAYNIKQKMDGQLKPGIKSVSRSERTFSTASRSLQKKKRIHTASGGVFPAPLAGTHKSLLSGNTLASGAFLPENDKGCLERRSSTTESLNNINEQRDSDLKTKVQNFFQSCISVAAISEEKETSITAKPGEVTQTKIADTANDAITPATTSAKKLELEQFYTGINSEILKSRYLYISGNVIRRAAKNKENSQDVQDYQNALKVKINIILFFEKYAAYLSEKEFTSGRVLLNRMDEAMRPFEKEMIKQGVSGIKRYRVMRERFAALDAPFRPLPVTFPAVVLKADFSNAFAYLNNLRDGIKDDKIRGVFSSFIGKANNAIAVAVAVNKKVKHKNHRAFIDTVRSLLNYMDNNKEKLNREELKTGLTVLSILGKQAERLSQHDKFSIAASRLRRRIKQLSSWQATCFPPAFDL